MKKTYKIMLIIFIIVVILLGSIYISTKINYWSNIKEYNNRQSISKKINSNSLNIDFKENNSIQLDDLTISIESLKYYPEGNNDYPNQIEGKNNNNLLLATINFSNTSNLSVDIKLLKYLIFDENNNIVAADYHSKTGLKYMKGFLYEKYEDKSFKNVSNYISSSGRTYNNITEDISKVSTTFAANLNSIPKQLTIRFFDFQYSIDGQTSKSLGFDDFEFVLNLN